MADAAPAADPRSAPTVLVARKLLGAGMERLAGACVIRDGGLDVTREELLELAHGVDAIVADPTVAVDEALLEAAGPQLQVVANFAVRSEEHTSELQSHVNLVCRLLLEKK